MKKRKWVWGTLVAALLMCVCTGWVITQYPLFLMMPPSSWPALVREYWNRSHIPGLPSLVPSPIPSITPAYATSRLTRDNLSTMRELVRLTPTTTPGPVAALAMPGDSQILLAAYAQEGVLRWWSAKDGELLTVFDIQDISIGTTMLDETGYLLATKTGQTPYVEAVTELTDTSVVRLWDIYSGDLIWEMDFGSRYGTTGIVSGVAVAPTHQRIAVTIISEDYESSLFICEIPIEKCSWMTLGGELEWYVRFNGLRLQIDETRICETPHVVTFDPTGEIIALADQEGRITLRWWNAEHDRIDTRSEINLDWGKREEHIKPLALAFDRARRWLAVVRGERFELWSLDGKHIRRTLSASIPTTAASDIAFSPTGDLVAIGVDTGWQIWDVERGRKIAEGGDSPAFALKFSPDGRLFLWGAEDGAVHIWGTSAP